MDELGGGAFLKNPATDRQPASCRHPRQPDAASFSARASATRSQDDHWFAPRQETAYALASKARPGVCNLLY